MPKKRRRETAVFVIKDEVAMDEEEKEKGS